MSLRFSLLALFVLLGCSPHGYGDDGCTPLNPTQSYGVVDQQNFVALAQGRFVRADGFEVTTCIAPPSGAGGCVRACYVPPSPTDTLECEHQDTGGFGCAACVARHVGATIAWFSSSRPSPTLADVEIARIGDKRTLPAGELTLSSQGWPADVERIKVVRSERDGHYLELCTTDDLCERLYASGTADCARVLEPMHPIDAGATEDAGAQTESDASLDDAELSDAAVDAELTDTGPSGTDASVERD